MLPETLLLLLLLMLLLLLLMINRWLSSNRGLVIIDAHTGVVTPVTE